MKTYLALVVVVVIAIWAAWPELRHAGTYTAQLAICDDTYDQSALHHIYGKFPQYNYLSVWLSGNYDPGYWLPRFQEEQGAINANREWADKQERCVRFTYSHWLDYWENDLQSARRELTNKGTKIEMDEYSAKNKLREEKYREYERTHEIPHP